MPPKKHLTTSVVYDTVTTAIVTYASSRLQKMPPAQEPLGSLELAVLQYVIDHHPITVREVAEHFAVASGHARTTVLTVMQRLRDKGYLRRRQRGSVQEYRPTIKKSELLQGMVTQFVQGVLGGNVSPFFAYLTQSASLTKDETRKLEQLLQQIEAREAEKPI